MLGVKIGIDFGSSSFIMVVEDKGIVLSEPSLVICDKYSGEVKAKGKKAKQMSEKLPQSMEVFYPIKDGVVYNKDLAIKILKNSIDKICIGKIFRPNILMSVPSTVTKLQRKTLFDVLISADVGTACFVDEALASAIGAGVSLTEPKGTLICNIGAGTTNSCVITMGNIALSETVNIGGNDLSKAIIDYANRELNIEIGMSTADEIKMTVGGAVKREHNIVYIACGKNQMTGLPVEFEIDSDTVYKVLKPKIDELIQSLLKVLGETQPELCGDIAENGIILTGGSANLYGLDVQISNKTGLSVVVADNPDECAALGLEVLLQDMKYLDRNGYIFKSVSQTNEDNEE